MIRKRKVYALGSIVLVRTRRGPPMVGEVVGIGYQNDYIIYVNALGYEIGLDHSDIYGTIENE